MNGENAEKKDFIGIYNIILKNWQRTSIMQGAAAMAYYLLLSLLPILLVVANIIPLLPFSSTEAISLIENAFPPDIHQMLVPIVEDYLNSGSGGAISIGLVTSIWSASKIISTLREILDEVYGVSQKENFLIARLLSLLIMIAILFLVGASVFVFVFGKQILTFISNFFDLKIPFFGTFLFLRWALFPIVLLSVGFIIYQLVPNHHLKVKYSIPGTVFMAGSLIILSESFSLLTSYIGGDAITNQTIGGFVALMFFLFVGSLILLFGALLNTLYFEIDNGQSVPEYELDVRLAHERKNTNWGGYPDNKQNVILKRKLYKRF